MLPGADPGSLHGPSQEPVNEGRQDLGEGRESHQHEHDRRNHDEQGKRHTHHRHGAPGGHGMLSGQDDVPGSGVDLNPLEDAGVEEAPEHPVAEDGAAPGGEDQFAAGDGHRGDDHSGAQVDPERREGGTLQQRRRTWIDVRVRLGPIHVSAASSGRRTRYGDGPGRRGVLRRAPAESRPGAGGSFSRLSAGILPGWPGPWRCGPAPPG